MRHGKKFNHLGRKKGHRAALLKNLSINIIEHKRINTTLAKAKALRVHVEPIITRSKTNTTHSRRVAFRYLNNKEAVKELFDVISPKIADRPGGYLRIIRTGFRLGDGAEMAMIEFVDFNTVYSGQEASGSTKKKRSRRSGAKKSTAAAVAEDAVNEVVEEAPVVETPAETKIDTQVDGDTPV